MPRTVRPASADRGRAPWPGAVIASARGVVARRVVIAFLVVGLAWAGVARRGVAAAAPSVQLRPIVGGLAAPTNVAVAPDGRLFFTEQQTGLVRVVDDGRLLPRPIARFDVVQGAETGLLGIALHPGFPEQPWIYVYLSDAADQRNEIVRFRADRPVTASRQLLFTGLPSVAGYHNGGDMAFGPDGSLYVAVGEAHDPELAQDPSSVGGKILRLEPDGSVPPDNPLGPDNPAFALGIRNSFGICFDPATGELWETENGPDRDDEVNRIEAGGNYGWPIELGAAGTEFVRPQLVFPEIIVPTGCAFTDAADALYFGDYRNGALHRAPLSEAPPRDVEGERVVAEAPSGITDVARAPGGDLYVVTSDAILLAETGREVEAASPSPSTPPATPAPRRDAVGRSAPPGRLPLVVVLLVVLAGALGVGLWMGARMRAGRRRAG
jgi:aldose sugar dehydrogenase